MADLYLFARAEAAQLGAASRRRRYYHPRGITSTLALALALEPALVAAAEAWQFEKTSHVRPQYSGRAREASAEAAEAAL